MAHNYVINPLGHISDDQGIINQHSEDYRRRRRTLNMHLCIGHL